MYARISFNSIRFKLIAGVLLVTVPLSLVLLFSNYYSIHVVRNQVADSNKNMISLYMGQIDEQLRFAESYLMGMATAEADFNGMESTVSESDRYFAMKRLSTRITDNLLNFKSVDGFFIYSLPIHYYMNSFRERTVFEEREAISAYVTQQLDTNAQAFTESGWFANRIGENCYLMRIFKVSDTYVGAWISIDNLTVPLNLIHLGEQGGALFAGEGGEPMNNRAFVQKNKIDINRDLGRYYLTGTDHRYLVVGAKSTVGNFSLVAVIPDEQILEKLPVLRVITNLILASIIVLVPICLLLLRKTVLLPINRLMTAMKRIQDGNLQMRIHPFRTSDEFRLVNETFNTMMSQIRDLRIHVYEEQMSKQKAELQHLQLQINPHFYLNSLNIMHTLARSKEYALIEELSQSLAHYFRYMFRSNLTVVALQDELQHVRHYLRIQEMRFPNHLRCEIVAPDYLLRTPVPPLVVQTFVENAIKHAVTLDEPVRLSIDAELLEHASEPFLNIRICDTGPGFPDDVLENIRNESRHADAEGRHVGIWNVQQRLRLLYKGRAAITFANSLPHGAVIDMLLPLQLPDTKGE